MFSNKVYFILCANSVKMLYRRTNTGTMNLTYSQSMCVMVVLKLIVPLVENYIIFLHNVIEESFLTIKAMIQIIHNKISLMNSLMKVKMKLCKARIVLD